MKVWGIFGQGCVNLKVWARLRQPKGMGKAAPTFRYGDWGWLRQANGTDIGRISLFSMLRKGFKWVPRPVNLLVAFLAALFLSLTLSTSAQSHWADLSVAEIVVGETEAQVTLTFPTGLVAEADDNRDGQLSALEVRKHKAQLETFLGERIRLTDGEGNTGALAVKPLDTGSSPSIQLQAGTHSTLLLGYSWPKPVRDLRIHYTLFLPGVSTSSCQATILQAGEVQSFIFTPKNREFLLSGSHSPWLSARNLLFALAGSFVWGAMHALSPGHGKTIVGAYLVGSRATFKHALFLALTTTITHTAGVFALGLVTLFASHLLVPEQVYPWLSFLSGLIIVGLGLNLSISRLRELRQGRGKEISLLPMPSAYEPAHTHAHLHEHESAHTHAHLHEQESAHTHAHLHEQESAHTHAHPHEHESAHYHHEQGHPHSHGDHSHLPPGADGSPVTWKSLLALGISGGLLPCPSALVVLLSATALGNIGFGLALVLVFSLGLAVVLTGIGLLLVYAGRFFDHLPKQMGAVRGLPAVSAVFVLLIGLGLLARSLVEIGLVSFNP